MRRIPRPRGCLLRLFRAPIGLYKIGLGGLLGERFLLLTHTGRRSGLPHQTVIEVVRHDPLADVYTVVSAWGEEADWYKNVMAHPGVEIQVGRRRRRAEAERVSPAEGAQIMLEYARKNPAALRMIARFMHYPLDGSEVSVRVFGEKIPIIVFRPEAE